MKPTLKFAFIFLLFALNYRLAVAQKNETYDNISRPHLKQQHPTKEKPNRVPKPMANL